MINTDVWVNKIVDLKTLRIAITRVLDIQPDALQIVERPASDASPNPDTALQVERWLYRGQFPMRLAFWPLDDQTAVTSMDDIRKLCAVLDCHCLIDDGSLAPFSMLEVSAEGVLRSVTIDADKEDVGEISLKEQE